MALNGSNRWGWVINILAILGAVLTFLYASGRLQSIEADIVIAHNRQVVLNRQIHVLKKAVVKLQRIKADIIRAIRQVVREHLHHQSYQGQPRAQAVAFHPPRFCWGKRITKYGTNGDDIITGTDGPDVIWTGPGNDAVFGDGGNDRICGGKGNDTLVGDPGTDYVSGGPGNDQCVAEHKRKCES